MISVTSATFTIPVIASHRPQDLMGGGRAEVSQHLCALPTLEFKLTLS